MTDEELHLEASGYATRRMDELRLGVPSVSQEELLLRWLSHYEGYREGYWVATGDTRFSTDPARSQNEPR